MSTPSSTQSAAARELTGLVCLWNCAGAASTASCQVATLPDHAVLVDDAGLIAAVLPAADMDAHVAALKAAGGTIASEVDCGGRAVLPGEA